MELDQFKSLWQAEKQKLENRIEVNEKLLRKIQSDMTISKFDSLLKVSIWGRNTALIYFLVSLIMGVYAFSDLMYSIPCFLGGFAMLWSFTAHLSIKKPNYESLSIIDLQKSIARFRIHTAKMAKYDLGVVAFWFLTIAPIYLKLRHHVLIYDDASRIWVLVGIAISLILLLTIFSKFIYSTIDRQLKDSEERLDEILAFEKF